MQRKFKLDDIMISVESKHGLKENELRELFSKLSKSSVLKSKRLGYVWTESNNSINELILDEGNSKYVTWGNSEFSLTKEFIENLFNIECDHIPVNRGWYPDVEVIIAAKTESELKDKLFNYFKCNGEN